MLNQVQIWFPQRIVACVRFVALASSLFLAITPARTCPLCVGISIPEQTLADRLITGTKVVLAQATPHAGWQVEMVLRGDSSLRGQNIIIADATASISGGGFLLLVNDSTDTWRSLGKVGPSLLPFLKKVLALPPRDQLTDAEWAARLEFFQPYLDSFDPRLAASAWAEWSRAPYRLLRSTNLNRERIRAWLDDSANPERHALWFVLLGLCGDQDDAAFVAARVRAAWMQGKDTNLAAMLSAQIELAGPATIEFIERSYICDPNRTLEEVQAAISALSVQGREGAPKMRPLVEHSFRLMVERRRPLAGFVARDLAAWGQWDVWSDFAQMLRSGEPIYPSARPAIVDFLRLCPLPEAQAELEPLGIAKGITKSMTANSP